MNIELEEHTKADYDYQTTVATVLSLARRAKEIFESSEVQKKNNIFELSILEIHFERQKA